MLIALIAAVALIATTTALAQQAGAIERATETRLSASELRADLLAYGRASDLAFLRHSSEANIERNQAIVDIRERLAKLDRDLESPQSRQALEQARRTIDEYLAVRSAAERGQSSLSSVIEVASNRLKAAEQAADNLEVAGKAEADAARRAVERWDGVANKLGGAVVLILIGGTALALIGMKRLVYDPLRRLEETIVAFASGTRGARAKEDGPVEIRTVSHVFNDLADRLSQEEQNRFTFLAGVAHDLRNPLSALRLSAESLDRADRSVSLDRIHKTLSLIARQVNQLERMIGDFLDAARIEAGRLELEVQRVDLRLLVEDIVVLYRPASPKHELSLSVPDREVTVHCDPVRIGQVLSNLVSNAVKYSPHGGKVTVSLATEGGEATIAVRDQGIGMSREDRRHVFEPFRRSGVSRELVPGVGLGLSVSRRITEAHGGRIEVETSIGVGSIFRVYLPIAQGAPTEAHRPAPLAPGHH